MILLRWEPERCLLVTKDFFKDSQKKICYYEQTRCHVLTNSNFNYDWGASNQIYSVLKPDPRFMSVAKNFKWLKPWLESFGWQLGLEVVLIDVLVTPLVLSKKTVFDSSQPWLYPCQYYRGRWTINPPPEIEMPSWLEFNYFGILGILTKLFLQIHLHSSSLGDRRLVEFLFSGCTRDTTENKLTWKKFQPYTLAQGLASAPSSIYI